MRSWGELYNAEVKEVSLRIFKNEPKQEGSWSWFSKQLENHVLRMLGWGFPSGSVVKDLPYNAGHVGSIPGPGRFHTLQSN